MDVGEAAPDGPLVSIVTPCLNAGPPLAACLESVRRQSYPRIEHIVVDGGSTDGTVARLTAADGLRWVSEPDHGQANALNKGFAMARGEILTWLCADDELLPEAVARVVGALAETGAQWAYGDCEIVAPDWSELRRSWPSLTPGVYAYGNPISQPGTFFRADAFRAVGGTLDESLDLAFDFDLWLRFTLSGLPAAYVREALAVFHISPESKTGRNAWAAFLREEALSLVRRGPSGLAAFRLGVSAAVDALEHGRVARGHLRREVAERSALVPAGDRLVVRAAASAEATFLELPDPRALRHLLDPAVWRVAETRRQVLFRIGRRARTALTGRRERALHPSPRFLADDPRWSSVETVEDPLDVSP